MARTPTSLVTDEETIVVDDTVVVEETASVPQVPTTVSFEMQTDTRIFTVSNVPVDQNSTHFQVGVIQFYARVPEGTYKLETNPSIEVTVEDKVA